jgi:hypothetical protein
MQAGAWIKKKREAKEKHEKGNQHGRNKRRRITVTSSLNETSTFQLGNRVVVRGVALLRPHPPLSTAEPEVLIFLGAQESVSVSKASFPPAYVAWWASTITLFLLGS